MAGNMIKTLKTIQTGVGDHGITGRENYELSRLLLKNRGNLAIQS